MEEYIIYIKMPSYLAQWFIHEHGGSPVRLKKGSAESLILQLYLTKPPSDYVPKQQQPDEVAIIIPEFKLKDPASYFYLSKKAVALFVETVHKRFVVQLFNDIHSIECLGSRKDKLIEAWMETNGIEYTGATWDVITKNYQRACDKYRQNKCRDKKKSEKHKKY